MTRTHPNPNDPADEAASDDPITPVVTALREEAGHLKMRATDDLHDPRYDIGSALENVADRLDGTYT